MFNILKRKPKLPDYSFLGVDLHSHLLPGIDDGARSIGHSLALIEMLHNLGFHTLITTPHVMAEMYTNNPEIINYKHQEVLAALKEKEADVKLHAAAEYLMDEGFGDKIESGRLLTLPGKRVLVEMSFFAAPPMLEDYLFRLQTKGYRPVLAHPERYLFLKGDLKKYRELKDRGCEFQLNLLSLGGYYGKPTRENAFELLEAGLIDFLASDLHHEGQAERLQEMLWEKSVAKALKKGEFRNGELGG
ncbi:MAG: hypothetical protein H6557_05460 [Lewinellaceae bacterium]|nr:hypothetical protein [Lewinellaceae bacterium]